MRNQTWGGRFEGEVVGQLNDGTAIAHDACRGLHQKKRGAQIDGGGMLPRLRGDGIKGKRCHDRGGAYNHVERPKRPDRRVDDTRRCMHVGEIVLQHLNANPVCSA